MPVFGIDGAGVAAADVDAERHAGESFDKRIVGVDGTLEVSFRVFATGAHSVQGNLIDIGGITRRVDLNVLAAGVYQFADDLPFDLNHMLDKVI